MAAQPATIEVPVELVLTGKLPAKLLRRIDQQIREQANAGYVRVLERVSKQITEQLNAQAFLPTIRSFAGDAVSEALADPATWDRIDQRIGREITARVDRARSVLSAGLEQTLDERVARETQRAVHELMASFEEEGTHEVAEPDDQPDSPQLERVIGWGVRRYDVMFSRLFDTREEVEAWLADFAAKPPHVVDNLHIVKITEA